MASLCVALDAASWDSVEELTSLPLPDVDASFFIRSFFAANEEVLVDTAESWRMHAVEVSARNVVCQVPLDALRNRRLAKVPQLEARLLLA